MPVSLRHPLSVLAVGVAGLIASPAAQAIVSTSAPSNWTNTSLDDYFSAQGLTENSLDGVARLSIGGVGCSGALLSGGAYVLTAAHCVTNTSGVLTASGVSLWFDNGAVTASVSSASQITVYSSWDGDLGNNNDLALLRLDSAVTSVAGYGLYSGTVSPGMGVLLAGYGYTGTGSTGYVNNSMQTSVHWGANQYDTLLNSNPGWDFDNGTADNNSFALLGGTSGTGLGVIEATVAPGDSGGPSFALVSGQLYLAGIHSFITSYGTNFGDALAGTNSSYGDAGGDTVLFSTQRDWISGISSPVPEPTSLALTLAGLGLFASARRRLQPRFPQPD